SSSCDVEGRFKVFAVPWPGFEPPTSETRRGRSNCYVGEIHSRLLDHKVFTQGHTRFFIKEFEEKRGWREEHQAEKLAQAVKEMSFTLVPDKETTHNMAAVLSRLQAVNHMSSRILQCENSSDENATLEEGRARRRVAWEQ
uniref:Biogenesis of lysosome-related organelles complex 1 subunit 5 n=1 Tax=Eptatretus burgeri TaxID=7764 RepID=A0A8C4QE89_EPTBU